MMTGRSSNPVFDRKPVNLYSDLLLHDVGTGDGIEQAGGEGERDPDAGIVGVAGAAAVHA